MLVDSYCYDTVYVGNVAPEVTDAELRRLFQQFGLVLEVKLYRKGSYGFIQYQAHEDAVNAIVSLNGQVAKPACWQAYF